MVHVALYLICSQVCKRWHERVDSCRIEIPFHVSY
ncbi:F-box protein [Pyrococcus sp. NA2]